MKIAQQILPINGNHLRWLAVLLWLLAGALMLWSFYWQENVDVKIRQHLVMQSKQAMQQIEQDLKQIFIQDNKEFNEDELLSIQDPQTRESITKGVNQAVLRLNLGAQGFGVLIARSGTLLAYPDSRLLGTNALLVPAGHNNLLTPIVQRLQRGQLMTFSHPVTGKELWMVLSYVQSLDADLGLIIDAEELRNRDGMFYWQWDSVFFLFLAGGVILLGSWRFPEEPNLITRRIFVVISASLLSFLITLWYEALDDIPLHEGETLLVDRESTELAWRRSKENVVGELDEVSQPIHIEIHHIQLTDASEITLSGNVVVIGNADSSPPVQIQDAISSTWHLQRQLDDIQEWHFVVKLKQSMDYHAFPFDQDVLTLTLLAPATVENSILTPLFSSYNSMATQSLPGIMTGARATGGWKIEQAYFSYHSVSLYPDNQFLGLRYNIAVQRGLVGPLISHVMPLCVISFLTYCMLLLWTKDKKKQALWGFSTATELQYSASLFFILVISHVALRESLNVQGVVFIEYFYFISYLQIILIAIGSLLYTSKIDIEKMSQKNSLLLKQWYWPSIFIICIALTLLFL